MAAKVITYLLYWWDTSYNSGLLRKVELITLWHLLHRCLFTPQPQATQVIGLTHVRLLHITANANFRITQHEINHCYTLQHIYYMCTVL